MGKAWYVESHLVVQAGHEDVVCMEAHGPRLARKFGVRSRQRLRAAEESVMTGAQPWSFRHEVGIHTANKVQTGRLACVLARPSCTAARRTSMPTALPVRPTCPDK